MAARNFRGLPQRQPIASQLSSAEMALDGRIQSAVEAPPFVADEMTPNMTAYALLRQDLEDRSALNRTLAEEQRLAFNSSARNEMARVARENDEMAKGAQSAIAGIPAMLNGGMSIEEATSNLLKENPNLAMNSFFVEGIKPFGAMVEDDHKAFMRREGQKVAETGLLAKGFDAKRAFEEGKLTIENLPVYLNNIEKSLEAKSILADASVVQANSEKARQHARWLVGQRNRGFMSEAVREFTGERLSGVNPASQERLENFFSSKGYRFADIPTFMSNVDLTQSQMGFMTDDELMGRIAEREGLESTQALADQIAVLGNPGATPEESANAERILRQGGGLWQEEYKSEIAREKSLEALRELDKEHRTGYRFVTDKIRDLVFNPENFGEVESGLDSPGPLALAESRQSAIDFVTGVIRSKGLPMAADFSAYEKYSMMVKSISEAEFNQQRESGEITDFMINQAIIDGHNQGMWWNPESAPMATGLDEEGKMFQSAPVIDFADDLQEYIDKAMTWTPRLSVQEPAGNRSGSGSGSVPRSNLGGGALSDAVTRQIQRRQNGGNP